MMGSSFSSQEFRPESAGPSEISKNQDKRTAAACTHRNRHPAPSNQNRTPLVLYHHIANIVEWLVLSDLVLPCRDFDQIWDTWSIFLARFERLNIGTLKLIN